MAGSPNSGDRFFEEIIAFDDFGGIARDENFTPVPDDWIVVITDVKDSTRAIAEGRYKDVNTLGAASISVVQNALPDLEFPFVFGGDGATLVIPPSLRATVEAEMARLRQLAQERFDIELRAGSCSVAEVRAQGTTLEVGKLELVPEAAVAVFRGDGLARAEALIKAPESSYEIQDHPPRPLALDGLSCRWQPVPHQNGNILSVLVQARGPRKGEIYAEVLQEIDGLFEGGLAEASPVDTRRLVFKSLGECVSNERRYHSSVWTFAFLARLVVIFMGMLLYKAKAAALLPGARHYKEAMGTHNDQRKFDGILRMVIDCSDQQLEALTALLRARHERGEVYFGIHRTDHSLMSCYLRGMADGKHLHFIDGGDGGYAMAARELKDQQRQS